MELLLRENAKLCVHMDLNFIAVALAPHDEWTH